MNILTIEKSQRDPSKKPWWWISGDTYPHRDLLKLHGARWSKKRKSWYLIAWELPDTIQELANDMPPAQDDDAPCSDEEAERILGVKLQPKAEPETQGEDEEPQHIRIIKPEFTQGESDVVISAIRQTKAEDLPIIQTAERSNTGRRTLARIPQAPCGELTGSITGSVWCYGWATHEGICVYVNMGGPRMAVEAIRAKLSKGEIVSCVPWDAPSIELTAGEGNTGMYSAFMQNIPEAKFTSLILCHELLTQPNYGGASMTFIFHVSDEQVMTQLRHHVTKLVNVPIFPAWTGYLWDAGQRAMLLRPTRTGGDVKLWTVALDADAWTRLITGGLAEGIIQLSMMDSTEAR